MNDSTQGSEKAAWVLTFYSYKGGVGRTLALSNLARYLTEELGYRVGLIDLDTESPGLSNEPLCGDLDPGTTTRDQLIQKINDNAGFVEALLDESLAPEGAGDKTQHENIIKYVVPLPVEGNGSLFLIPAGRRETNSHRIAEIESFNKLTSLLKTDHLATLANSIVKRLKDKLHLDFVFIDGRTGTTPLFYFYAYAVPHALVLFTGLNDQNVLGSLSILREAKTDENISPVPVFLVASPVPTVNPQFLEDRLQFISRELSRIKDEAQKDDGLHPVFAIPDQVAFALPYIDLASYIETYFIKKYPHSALSREYIRLARTIESLISTSSAGVTVQECRTSNKSIELWDKALRGRTAPFKIAAEDIAHEPLSEFITERLGYEESDWIPDEGYLEFIKAGGREGQAAIRLHLWEATHTEAPWERLIGGKDGGVDFDIVMTPQSSMGGVKLDLIWRFDEIRKKLKGRSDARSGSPSDLSVLNYEFLDRWYPGWRRWCSSAAGLIGLPLSANTTFLCADNSHLEALCRNFWVGQGMWKDEETKYGSFFPSSWELLRELLTRSGGAHYKNGKGEWSAFALAEKGRGIYYEWMNVVLAKGGGDLELVEGDVVTDLLLREQQTEEGTKLFLDIAAAAYKDSLDMTGVQKRYAAGELALYVAWSDSFRFDRENGSGFIRPADVKPDSESKGKRYEQDKIRLGMIPRDMRFDRRPLVAGWTMIFPKSNPAINNIDSDKGRLEQAITFAELFLDPEAQEELLSRGFPSPCLPVIEKQLQSISEMTAWDSKGKQDQSHSDTFWRNYKVFLKSQQAALRNGHWVHSTPNSPKIIDSISDRLREVVKKRRCLNDKDIADIFDEAFVKKIDTMVKEWEKGKNGASTTGQPA
jgi:CobQ/CobB/MinD/ParA nucleotide binding domain